LRLGALRFLLVSNLLVDTLHELHDFVVIGLGSLRLARFEFGVRQFIEFLLLGDGSLEIAVQHLNTSGCQTTHFLEGAVFGGLLSLLTHLLLQIVFLAAQLGFLLLQT